MGTHKIEEYNSLEPGEPKGGQIMICQDGRMWYTYMTFVSSCQNSWISFLIELVARTTFIFAQNKVRYLN